MASPGGSDSLAPGIPPVSDNNFTKALPVTPLEARADVVRRNAEDDDIGTPESFRLSPSADATHLRLVLPSSYRLPLAIDVRVAFKKRGDKPELFSFRFYEVAD